MLLFCSKFRLKSETRWLCKCSGVRNFSSAVSLKPTETMQHRWRLFESEKQRQSQQPSQRTEDDLLRKMITVEIENKRTNSKSQHVVPAGTSGLQILTSMHTM